MSSSPEPLPPLQALEFNAAENVMELVDIDTPICGVDKPTVKYFLNRKPTSREVSCNQCNTSGVSIRLRNGRDNYAGRTFYDVRRFWPYRFDS